MNTFLPYPSFAESARVLDRQRLGKQRVEVLQLLRALTGQTKGWANHPAALMWRGHEAELAAYGLIVCVEWRVRGYKDSCYDKILDVLGTLSLPFAGPAAWFGDDAFHASHRSNLLRKDPEHYGQFGWTEPHDLPYVWPVPERRAA